MKFSTLISAAIVTVCAQHASAQSSIGFQDIQLSAALDVADGSQVQTYDSAMDIHITGAHGLQLDLGSIIYPDTDWGHVAGHIYMAPGEYAKYGLFGSFADANGTSTYNAAIGIEGLWQLGDALTLEARAGTGLFNPDNIDYIFAGGAASYAASDAVELTAKVDWMSLEETSVSATSIDATLGGSYHINRFEIFAGVRHSYLEQETTTQNETALLLQAKINLGSARSARSGVKDRFFTATRPLKSVLTAGILDYE